MIEILPGFPPHVAAFKAIGKIDERDYKEVVMPEVERVAKAFGKINFLLELDTDVSNYSIGAWIDDALLGIRHITQWKKVAIVSRQEAIKKITDLFGHLVPGEYKGFKMENIDEARKWVSE
jgi:hypothetical protein